MSALDDLKASVQAVNAAVQSAIDDIKELAARVSQDSISDADAEDIAGQLSAVAKGLQDAVDASKPVPPAP